MRGELGIMFIGMLQAQFSLYDDKQKPYYVNVPAFSTKVREWKN
jgi:hypothetical protein